jgi:hypothetical protein
VCMDSTDSTLLTTGAGLGGITWTRRCARKWGLEGGEGKLPIVPTAWPAILYQVNVRRRLLSRARCDAPLLFPEGGRIPAASND